MDKLDEITWTDQELESIHVIATWYANIVEARGHEAPDHVLRGTVGRCHGDVHFKQEA